MCEFEQRNLAIIEAIMLDLGVSDIEELPAKVHEIKLAAQHCVERTGYATRTELANAYADALLAKKRAKNASRSH